MTLNKQPINDRTNSTKTLLVGLLLLLLFMAANVLSTGHIHNEDHHAFTSGQHPYLTESGSNSADIDCAICLLADYSNLTNPIFGFQPTIAQTVFSISRYKSINNLYLHNSKQVRAPPTTLFFTV